MLFSFKSAMAAIALGSLTLVSVWAQPPAKNWKDRAEYDLVQSISKEQNPQTKLGLLNQWKEKYPASDYKDDRNVMFIQTYQAAANGKGMVDVAKEMVAADAKSFVAQYYLTLLTISMNDTSAGALETGAKASESLLGLLDDTFNPAKKPAASSDEQWKKERTNMEALAYRTLGWVAMQQQKFEDAEKNFYEVLKRNPADAQASVWTATVEIRTRKLDKQSTALFHYARSAYFDGQGAFPQATRDQLRNSFEKAYLNFHGDKGGIDDVVTAAKAAALPPDGFKVESKDEILIKQEEELKKSNPVLAFWIGIKKGLTGADGMTYFNDTVKNAHLPGGVDVGGTKLDKFKGKLVSCDAPKKPKKIVVGISSPDMSEITLVYEDGLVACPDKGIDIEWSGAATEFTAEPFNLTFEVEPTDVIGVPAKLIPKKAPAPAAAPAAPAKGAAAPAAAKKAAPKK